MSKAKEPQFDIVLVELLKPVAGKIYHGISNEEVVDHPTVRGLVDACEQSRDAWVSLVLRGSRKNQEGTAPDLLQVQVESEAAPKFVERLSRVPGIRQISVAAL